MLRILAVTASLLMAACQHPHPIQIMARDSSQTGAGVAHEEGSGTGPISLTIGTDTYTGRWAIGSTGTTLGFGTSSGVAFAGTAMATGFGTGTTVASTGQITATALLTAPGHKSMRCQLQYSEWTMSGTGVCQDGGGRLYDVIILE